MGSNINGGCNRKRTTNHRFKGETKMSIEDAFYDILPDIAWENYWIEKDGILAKAPAFCIVPIKNTGQSGYYLILNHVGKINRYKKLKAAQERIKSLVESANYPMKIYKQNGRGRLSKKPFAENTIDRLIDGGVEGAPIRAFNIEEWESQLAVKR